MLLPIHIPDNDSLWGVIRMPCDSVILTDLTVYSPLITQQPQNINSIGTLGTSSHTVYLGDTATVLCTVCMYMILGVLACVVLMSAENCDTSTCCVGEHGEPISVILSMAYCGTHKGSCELLSTDVHCLISTRNM